MTRPSMHCLVRGDDEKPAPLKSWWAEPITGSFYAKCCDELKRMRQSKEAHRMGSTMVIAQVDGKHARTS